MIQWWHDGNYWSGEQEQFVSPLQTVSHQALQEPLGWVGPKLGWTSEHTDWNAKEENTELCQQAKSGDRGFRNSTVTDSKNGTCGAALAFGEFCSWFPPSLPSRGCWSSGATTEMMNLLLQILIPHGLVPNLNKFNSGIINQSNKQVNSTFFKLFTHNTHLN